MKVLITSGGTKIPIDSVRSVTNMSRGTFGAAICKAMLEEGCEVDFLMAEESRTPFGFMLQYEAVQESEFDACRRLLEWLVFAKNYKSKYSPYMYKTFEQYQRQMSRLLSENKYDIVILAAAVSDFGVEDVVNGKIRSKSDLNITLSPLPKVIGEVKKIQPDTFLVGFKLLVNSKDKELIEAAKNSIKVNRCNLVVANDLADIKAGDHRVLLVSERNVLEFTKSQCTRMGKNLAQMVVEDILAAFNIFIDTKAAL